MKTKSWIAHAFVGVGLGLGSLVACNNGGGGGSSSGPAPSVITTSNPAPYCVNGVCYTNYGTPTQSLVSANVTFVAIAGTYAQAWQNTSAPTLPSGVGTMTLSQGWSTLMSDVMGICNRANQTGGSTGGNYNCSAFMNGVNELAFTFSGNSGSNVNLTIESIPQNTGYYYSAPSAGDFALGLLGIGSYQNVSGLYDPLTLPGTMAPINNSAGFEIRAFGPTGTYGHGKLIQLQIPSGSIANAQNQFILYYNSAQAATGTLNNCQSTGCPTAF
jgi:hypothetical protein